MLFLDHDKAVSISEFRKTPIIASNERAMCILKDNKDVFYCLNKPRYEQLLDVEKQFNEMMKGGLK